MKIESIEMSNEESLLVEVLDIELSEKTIKNIKKKLQKKSTVSDMPEGAKPIGVMDDIKISMELLKYDLSNISNTVKDSFKENQPDEFSVEVSFGFAGEFAIPYITSAKTDGGIKVKATWKKDK